MNPSASGWIKKLLNHLEKSPLFSSFSTNSFYNELRKCGFIYGSNIRVVDHSIDNRDLTEEEVCKINLCIAFLHAYNAVNNTKVQFIESIINFYTEIDAIKTSFFRDLLGGNKSHEQLENIIHKRTQIDPNILTKNFNYFITNALLYTDVLAYTTYLKQNSISVEYLKQLEASIACISLNTLNTKKEKTKYDNSLIKLFESSLRYQDNSNISLDTALQFLTTIQEKCYALDLACMASWSDKIIDEREAVFLNNLGESFNFTPQDISQALNTVDLFYTTNKDSIALLSSKNIVQSFYNNSSRMVKKLIGRNSKRLYKELLDSKELMILLSQSTVRDLNAQEQKKVQDQLIDIFKSIPSLAIFILPGGSLLLPLVIKFIPKLLPSAFDENRIEEDH